MATIDYYSSNNDIYRAVLSSVLSIYNRNYSFLGLSKEKIDEIINAAIKKCKEDIKEEVSIEKRIVDFFKNEINLIMSQMKPWKLVILFINDKLYEPEEYNEAVKEINALYKFISSKNVTLEPDDYEIIFNKNKLLWNIIKFIVDAKIGEISSKPLDEIFLENEFLILLVSIYCLMNNIEIIEEEDKEEQTEKGESIKAGSSSNFIKALSSKKLTREEERAIFKLYNGIKLDEEEEEIVKGDDFFPWYKGGTLSEKEKSRVKDYIVTHNLRLVAKIASKKVYMASFDDLFQVGCMGLIKAVDKFDISKGNKFSTYVTWWIRQAIGREIADNAKTIRIPVHLVEKLNKFHLIRDQLSKESGKEPTTSELASALKISEDDVLELFEYDNTVTVSYDTPVGDDSDSSLVDFLPGDQNIELTIFDSQLTTLIEQVFAKVKFKPREIDVIKKRTGLFDGRIHTLEEIGKDHGVTRERIRQIEKKVKKKISHSKIARDILSAYIPEERTYKNVAPEDPMVIANRLKKEAADAALKAIQDGKDREIKKKVKALEKTKNDNGTDSSFFVRIINSGESDATMNLDVAEERILYILNRSFPYEKNVRSWDSLFDVFGSDLKSGDGTFDIKSSDDVEKRIIRPVRKQLREIDWSKITITEEDKVIPNGGVMTKPKTKVLKQVPDSTVSDNTATNSLSSKGVKPSINETTKDIKPKKTALESPSLSESGSEVTNDGVSTRKTFDVIDYIKRRVKGISGHDIKSIVDKLPKDEQIAYNACLTKPSLLASDFDLLAKIIDLIRIETEKKNAPKDENGFNRMAYFCARIADVKPNEIEKAVNGLSSTDQDRYREICSKNTINGEDELLLETIVLAIRKNRTEKVKKNAEKKSDDWGFYFVREKLDDATPEEVAQALEELDDVQQEKYNGIKSRAKTKAITRLIQLIVNIIRKNRENKTVVSEPVNEATIVIEDPIKFSKDYINDKLGDVTLEEINMAVESLNLEMQKMYHSLKTFGTKEKELFEVIIQIIRTQRIAREMADKEKPHEPLHTAFDYIRSIISDVTQDEIEDALSHTPGRTRGAYNRINSEIEELSSNDKNTLDRIIQKINEIRKNKDNQVENNEVVEDDTPGFIYIQKRVSGLTVENLHRMLERMNHARRDSYYRLLHNSHLSNKNKKTLDDIVSDIKQNFELISSSERKLEGDICFDYVGYIQERIPEITAEMINEELSLLSLNDSRLIVTNRDKALKELIMRIAKKRFPDNVLDIDERSSLAYMYIKERIPDISTDELHRVLEVSDGSLKRCYYCYFDKVSLQDLSTDILDRIVSAVLVIRKNSRCLASENENQKNQAFNYIREHIKEHIPYLTYEMVEQVLLQTNDERRQAYYRIARKKGELKTADKDVLDNIAEEIIAAEAENVDYAFAYIRNQIFNETQTYLTHSELENVLNFVDDRTKTAYTRIKEAGRNISSDDKKVLNTLVTKILAIRKPKIIIPVNDDSRVGVEYLPYVGAIIPDVTLDEIATALDKLTPGVIPNSEESIDEIVKIIIDSRPNKEVVIDRGNLANEYIKKSFPGLTDDILYASLSEIYWKKAMAYVRINNASSLSRKDEKLLGEIVKSLKEVGLVKKIEIDSYFDYLGYVRRKIPNTTFKEVNEELLLLPVNVSRKIKNIKEPTDEETKILDDFVEKIKERRRQYAKKKNDYCEAFKYIRDRVSGVTPEEIESVLSNVHVRGVGQRLLVYKRLSKLDNISTTEKQLLNRIIADINEAREEKKIRTELPGEEGSKAFRYIQDRVSGVTPEEINEVFAYVSTDGRRVTTVGTRRAYDKLITKNYLEYHDKEVLNNLAETILLFRKRRALNNNMYQLEISFAYIQDQIYDVRQNEIDEALLLLSSSQQEKYKTIEEIGKEEKKVLDALIDKIKGIRKSKGIEVGQESLVFKYIKERVKCLKQDEIDEALLLLSVDQRCRYESISVIGEDEKEVLDALIRCINANREVNLIRKREINNAAFKYISDRIQDITLEELYVVLGQLNARTREGYQKRSLLPVDAFLDSRQEALLSKVVDAINAFREKNGTDGYVQKMKKYFDYLWYIESQIPDATLDEIDAAIESLESNMLYVFNNTYRNTEIRHLQLKDYAAIDQLLDTMVTIINNNRLGIDTPKIRGKINSELSFYDYMARRLRASNNPEFRSKINLICEYLSNEDNNFLKERFGEDRNKFSGHGPYTEIEDKNKHDTDARILNFIQDHYQQPNLLNDKIRCSTFYGYLAHKLKYPEGIERDPEFRKKVKLTLLTSDSADVSYLKIVYGDDLEGICKVPEDATRLEWVIIRIRDKYLADNPGDEYYECVDNSNKIPFNQYFANLLNVTLTPDVEADFDKIFMDFSEDKRNIANMYWGENHNVYQRSPKYNFKNNSGELGNFIYVFRGKYETLVSKKRVRIAYNKGLVPFVKALIGDKIDIDPEKLEYTILKKINHKFKCEFITAFGHDLSSSYQVDDETYDSLVMIVPRQVKHAYLNVKDSEVSEYFASNESVIKESAKVVEPDGDNSVSPLGLLLVGSIGKTIRDMSMYSLVHNLGLTGDEAGIVSYALNMPYNFDIKEVSKQLGKSESDIRKALSKLLSKVRSGIDTALATEEGNIDERAIALNGGKVRIFFSNDYKK